MERWNRTFFVCSQNLQAKGFLRGGFSVIVRVKSTIKAYKIERLNSGAAVFAVLCNDLLGLDFIGIEIAIEIGLLS